jgi:hypothetical protein
MALTEQAGEEALLQALQDARPGQPQPTPVGEPAPSVAG